MYGGLSSYGSSYGGYGGGYGGLSSYGSSSYGGLGGLGGTSSYNSLYGTYLSN